MYIFWLTKPGLAFWSLLAYQAILKAVPTPTPLLPIVADKSSQVFPTMWHSVLRMLASWSPQSSARGAHP